MMAKGIHVTTSLEYAFIIALANPVGPLLGTLIADRMERKWQIVTAGAFVAIFMYLFALQQNATLIIVFGVLVTLSNNWISFLTHGYQSEQYPTRIRARAVGFVYSWSRVSAALAGLLIGFFLHEGGTMGVALFIGGAMVVMIVTIGGFGTRTSIGGSKRSRTRARVSPTEMQMSASRSVFAMAIIAIAGWAGSLP